MAEMSGGKPPSGRLSGRHLLVVGASSGIGRAIGVQASREGACVTLTARRVERLDAAVAECGAGAFALRCDVRKERSCQVAVAGAVDAMGGLDALVYAAGITRFTEIGDASSEDWEAVLATNLIGAGLVSRYALPYLDRAAGGAVYLSSTTSALLPPLRGIGLYTISKLGLNQLVRCLQIENPRVDFTALVVGPTATGFARDAPVEARQRLVDEWFTKGDFTGEILDPRTHASVVVDILSSPGRVETMTVAPSPARTSAHLVPTPETYPMRQPKRS